ncbi:MAG: hypothetical protein QNJ68_00640 [Microcoleaceae cyanobacterium MO_207.B10]|nr:hypothetical protein [Microcoleaceae cyanobacterium MO_207.B10]
MQRLADKAREYNLKYGKIWHSSEFDYFKNYGNTNFYQTENLYRKGRDMMADMEDISNLSYRLEDFVGKLNIYNKFVLNSEIDIEETRYFEFKDISKSRRPED